MSNIIDINKHKIKLLTKKELTKDRKPLYVDYLNGEVKGSPHFKRHDSEDFIDRLLRIKDSIERINNLMKDLKEKENRL